ncbi:hypothetical protein [Epilithonimonas sp.]|uniref:hypothetical protein n=1 Tax=Epilithonimonas sp. TaxID=2894511 RepID=UPI002FDD4B9C
MKKDISIFGKQIKLNNIVFYVIFFGVFSIYSFVERPYIKEIYLNNDIKNFEDNYFWKIYLVLWFLLIIFGFYKVEKTKEKIAELGMTFLFFLVFGYILLNNFITTNTLFLNQLESTRKKISVYQVFNYDKDNISLSGISDKEYISEILEDEILNKIEKNRARNQLKPLNQIKHGDTVNVIFDKGLFGFKYLN